MLIYSLTFTMTVVHDCDNAVTVTSVFLQFTSVTVGLAITSTNKVNGWRTRLGACALSCTISYDNAPGVWRTTLASARSCGTVYNEEIW